MLPLAMVDINVETTAPTAPDDNNMQRTSSMRRAEDRSRSRSWSSLFLGSGIVRAASIFILFLQRFGFLLQINWSIISIIYTKRSLNERSHGATLKRNEPSSTGLDWTGLSRARGQLAAPWQLLSHAHETDQLGTEHSVIDIVLQSGLKWRSGSVNKLQELTGWRHSNLHQGWRLENII